MRPEYAGFIYGLGTGWLSILVCHILLPSHRSKK